MYSGRFTHPENELCFLHPQLRSSQLLIHQIQFQIKFSVDFCWCRNSLCRNLNNCSRLFQTLRVTNSQTQSFYQILNILYRSFFHSGSLQANSATVLFDIVCQIRTNLRMLSNASRLFPPPVVRQTLFFLTTQIV